MKNEEKIILRMLNSVNPIIDGCVCVDTGSTDKSKEIVKQFFDKYNKPCEIYDHAFINFEDARNYAIEKIKGKSDMAFWIDCDEEIILDPNFDPYTFKKQFEGYDSGTSIVNYHQTRYGRRQFFNPNKQFRWIGKVHEYLHCDEPIKDFPVNGISTLVHTDGASWENQREKYLNHAAIFEKEVSEKNDPRDVFYLAQSYRDAGETEKAIEWYRKRAEMESGFYEERYFSQYQVGLLLSKSESYDKSVCELLRCSMFDTAKAEHLVSIISEFQNQQQWEASYIFSSYAVRKFHNKNPYPNRILFLDGNAYSNTILDLHIINCQVTGRQEELKQIRRSLPKEKITIAYIAHNIDVFNKYLKPSLNNLKTDFNLEHVPSGNNCPATNYNIMLENSKTRYVLFVHEDVTFGPDFIDKINEVIVEHPDFGAIGAVGQVANKEYIWSEPNKIKELQVFDSCCILVNKDHGLKFDDKTFDEFHCYVDDYSMQVQNRGLKCYTIPIKASEADKKDVYENKVGYFKHHSYTVNKRGYCWGRYWEYNKLMHDKWSKKTEVDVCILSHAKNSDLEQVTRLGIKTLLESENNIKFNVFVMESNHEVSYDTDNIKTFYTTDVFNYNDYMNKLIDKGNAPYVVLCNNDLTYEKSWASNIISEMKSNPELMSASPFCPGVNIMNGSNTHYGYEIRKQLNGWCIFVKRELFNKIGKLDTSVNFWYSDNIYADQLRFNNIKHALVQNSLVNHHHRNLGITASGVSNDIKTEYTIGQHQEYLKSKAKYA